jgi:4-hydroxyacetophenone monooxygenase
MRLDFDAQPIEDDDATLRARLEGIPIGPLLAAVAHVTGDYTLLADDLRPDPSRIVMMTDDG